MVNVSPFGRFVESTIQKPASKDFWLCDHGSVWLFLPLTEAANTWIDEKIYEPQYYCGGIAVEPRYVDFIVQAFEADGLTF
jgi:hypothetical protein